MNRRNVLSVGLMPLVGGCLYDRFFELEWEEEAWQPDGSIIVVHRKEKFERYSQGLTPYGGKNLFVESTLTFDAGGSVGRVSQLFKGFWTIFIGQHRSTWYSVLSGAYPSRSTGEPKQNWGQYEPGSPQLGIKLVAGAWTPMSMSELPDVFQEPNLITPTEDLAKFAKAAKERLRWDQKHAVALPADAPSLARLLRPSSEPKN